MPPSEFQTTSWTLVRAAAGASTPDSRNALAKLCQKYWHTIYAFIRNRGYDQDQSRDLTQGFFALLIEKNYLSPANHNRGKFRSFLLTAVKHFLANEWDRTNALKRGGGHIPVSIDLVTAEGWHNATAVDHATPETLYERRWALTLLENVMSKLRTEFSNAGKAIEFERLSMFLNKDSDSARYETVAKELAISAGALRMSVHRFRQKYRQLLRSEITESVSRPEEIDEELRFLVSILGN